jgi:methylase of polypeptide subunit release factors
MQAAPSHQLHVPLADSERILLWQSAHAWSPPSQVMLAADNISADVAHRAVSQGAALVWQGDYHQARQMLAAIKRRLDKKSPSFDLLEWPARFHRIRLHRLQTARQAGLLLIEIKPGYVIDLARAPDAKMTHDALHMAYGERLRDKHFAVPLTELTGVLSAHEWHRTGLPVKALEQTIYPRWGVFAPTRHEYLDLVMQAELPATCKRAVDVGTGTGVLAMMLAKRGVVAVVATDTNPAALACAQDNITRAGLQPHIQVVNADLMPDGQFDLLICNPPWLPGAASGPLEAAIYDPHHQMLKGFLCKASAHLTARGQAWLILSDLAEHLQLRSRDDLLTWIKVAGLTVVNRLDTRPTHRKLQDTKDPMAAQRRAEITSLWQLARPSSLDETL